MLQLKKKTLRESFVWIRIPVGHDLLVAVTARACTSKEYSSEPVLITNKRDRVTLALYFDSGMGYIFLSKYKMIDALIQQALI